MEKDLDFVNTSEAYGGELRFVGAQLVVPLINVGVLPGHPLNPKGREQLFLDRSYLRFTSVHSLSCELAAPGSRVEERFVRDAQASGLVFYCGARNIFYPQDGEFRVVAATGELLLLPDSQRSAAHWVPIPTPLLRQNMPTSLVQPFLRVERWPLTECERSV